MSLTIKAYLQKENSECEIRRFLVDQGASSSFTYLTTKIPQVFPSLAGKQYDLFWKDEEGDDIAFSSDDELTEALGYVNDGLFRIYIRTKAGGAAAASSTEEVKHPGVVCDGCEGEIVGTRFKCCVCPDYDLCVTCENNGKHNEHNMFRIRIPGSFWRPGFMGFPPHGFGPPPPYGAHGGHGHGPWRGMKRAWRRWMKNMYEHSQQQQQGKDEETSECEKEAKEPRKEMPAKERAERQGAERQGEASARGEEEDSPTEEYLKDVGESVAEMLGPLGIDVNIDVECEGKRKKCTAGGRRGGRGRVGWGGCGMGGRWGWGRGPWAMGPPPPHMGRMGCPPGPWFPGAEAWNPFSRFGPENAGKTAEGCTAPETSCSAPPPPPTTEEDVAMGSPLRSDHGDGDWMVLDEERDASTPTTSSASSHNTAQAATSPPLHPIPKMADALERLMAMGFSNDGGWLTQLVESKDGDLNKILDAVKPHSVPAATSEKQQ